MQGALGSQESIVVGEVFVAGYQNRLAVKQGISDIKEDFNELWQTLNEDDSLEEEYLYYVPANDNPVDANYVEPPTIMDANASNNGSS